MKQRIIQRAFHLTVQISFYLLSFLIIAGRGLGFFSREARRAIMYPLKAGAPVALFFYFQFRKFKRSFLRFLTPIRGHLLYLFAHRYFVQGLVVLLVFATAIPALRAADSVNGNVSEELLLREFIFDQEEGEEIVDDIVPKEELESYLEGLFQDRPPAKGEENLPLALDGGTLLTQELPGTAVLPTRTEVAQYEVRQGDTIWAIAEEFGISVATILWENNLNLWSTIRPGQKLAILPVSGITHTVRKGETLGAITARYQTSSDEVVLINKLAHTGATLTAGAKLVIPGGRPYAAPQAPRARRREVLVPPPIAAIPGGKLLWPTVSRHITQYFKWRHAGLDIGDKYGSPIYASENGVVEFSGWGRGGWGNTVVVDHGGGLKTRYAHASKVLVEVGQQVKKGEVVALIGSTGRSTGAHLHLSVYVNGRSVNPLQYLR